MEDPTVDYLEERRQSDGRLPRKEREREGGREKDPCKLALKVHPGAMEHDRLPPRRLPEVRQRAV